MLSDRLLDFLQDRTGFVATKWSIVRIAACVVAALVVASAVLPARPGRIASAAYNSTLATRDTRNIALPLGDTRGFKPTSNSGAFKVAWIGGSETLAVGSKTRAFIPSLVTDRIDTVDGHRVSTDIYYLNAIRVADELAALSDALASKPDLVVISLNPVWVMNDLAVQQWDYLDGELAQHSTWPPSRWPVAASLVSPGDVSWKIVSGISPSAVGDRFEWGVELAERTERLTFLETAAQTSSPTATGLAALGQKRPVDFFYSRFVPSNKGTSLAATQLGILERQTASTSGFNRVIVQQMFEMVRRAGVNAYFYVPPIDPLVYAEPDAQRYLSDLRATLTETTRGRTSDRVVFDPRGLQDRVPTTKYEDIVHVLDGRPEADVLSQDLCALLVTQGLQPKCEGQ